MKTMKTLAAASLLATLGYGVSASANTVDLFDDPAANGVHTVTTTTVGAAGIVSMQYGPSTSILGGYRDLVSELVSSNGVGTPSATSEVGGGGYSFSSSSGDSGIGRIQWDGDDSAGDVAALNYTGLAGANLVMQEGCPDTGCTQFVAKVLVADLGFQYQIGIYTDASNFTILTSDTLFSVDSPLLATYDFDWFGLASGDYFLGGLPFNIFQGGAGADLENVGAIEFVVNSDGGTVAVDLALDSITKVPEPSVLGLLGLGLVGLGLARRRKSA